MSRAERRRAEREKAAKNRTYNFTQEQLDTYIFDAIQDRLIQIKKEAAEKATNNAMKLLFVLSAEVLMDNFWPKSYQRNIPKFCELLTDYYYKWQIGELDMDEMVKDLELYGGITFSEVEC